MSAWAKRSVSGQPGLHETQTKPQRKRKKHLVEEKVNLPLVPAKTIFLQLAILHVACRVLRGSPCRLFSLDPSLDHFSSRSPRPCTVPWGWENVFSPTSGRSDSLSFLTQLAQGTPFLILEWGKYHAFSNFLIFPLAPPSNGAESLFSRSVCILSLYHFHV